MKRKKNRRKRKKTEKNGQKREKKRKRQRSGDRFCETRCIRPVSEYSPGVRFEPPTLKMRRTWLQDRRLSVTGLLVLCLGRGLGIQDHGCTSGDLRWAKSPIANRQSQIARVQRTRSTLAGRSAVPRGTKTKPTNANRDSNRNTMNAGSRRTKLCVSRGRYNHQRTPVIRIAAIIGNEKSTRSFSDRSFFHGRPRGMSVPKCLFFSRIWRA